MVRDRMIDLHAKRSNRSNRSYNFPRRFLPDTHLQVAQDEKLQELLDEAEDIRTLIQLIAENVSIVKKLHNNILSYMNKDLQKELETRMCTISQTAFRVQQKLRDMGKGITANNLAINDVNAIINTKSTHTRIRMLQYTTMLKLFSEVMEDYNASSLKYQDKCQALLRRQRSLMRHQITSAELEMFDAPEDASLFINENILLLDTRRIKQQLSDIESRQNDILNLEKTLIEVKDMFMKMAFLVEKQGEQINNIEYYSTKTEGNINNAYKEIEQAEKKVKKNRKCKLWIAIIITLIVIIFFVTQIIIAS